MFHFKTRNIEEEHVSNSKMLFVLQVLCSTVEFSMKVSSAKSVYRTLVLRGQNRL